MWLSLISFVMELAKNCVTKAGFSLAIVAPFGHRCSFQPALATSAFRSLLIAML
jgi:hypothetical protein